MFSLLVTSYYLLFTYLSWRRPLAALWILVAASPSYLIRFEIFGIPMTLLEGMILILAAITAASQFLVLSSQFSVKNKLKTFIENWKLEIGNLGIPILLFLLASTASLFMAPDLRAAAGIWKAYFIEPVLFFLAFLTLVKTDRDRTSIISALSVSALVVSAFAIYQKFTGFEIPTPWLPEATRRVTSFYGYPNAVGLYLGPTIALFIGQLISSKKLLAIGYWLLVIGSSLAAIIFSRTEGAWIALPAGLLLTGLIIKKYRRIASILTILIVLTILTIPPLRTYTLQQLSFRGDSGSTRISIWKESLAMLQDQPILGAGLAGYQQAMIPYHKAKHIEIYLYPHNIFLNFWSETGLLGLIAFLWLLGIFFYKIFHYYTNPLFHYSTVSAMLVLLIHGLVDVPYFKNDLAILFWILLALIISLPGQPARPYSLPHQKLPT